MNGDGVPDLVISSDALEVRLAAIAGGTLTYGPPQRYTVGGVPVRSAIADFDGDGIPDLVVACQGGLLTQFRGK